MFFAFRLHRCIPQKFHLVIFDKGQGYVRVGKMRFSDLRLLRLRSMCGFNGIMELSPKEYLAERIWRTLAVIGTLAGREHSTK